MNEIPDKIWKLLDKPEKWTKHELARFEEGQFCAVTDPEAVCWCLEGACRKIYGSDPEYEIVMGRIREALQVEQIHVWNDSSEIGHADVLAVCKELDI